MSERSLISRPIHFFFHSSVYIDNDAWKRKSAWKKKNGKNQLCHPCPPHFHHYCCDECSQAYCIICSSVCIDNNTLKQMGNEKWLSGEWYQADARLVRVYLYTCTMALALIGEVSSSRTRKRELSPESDLMWVSECQGTWHNYFQCCHQ